MLQLGAGAPPLTKAQRVGLWSFSGHPAGATNRAPSTALLLRALLAWSPLMTTAGPPFKEQKGNVHGRTQYTLTDQTFLPLFLSSPI